MSTFDAIAAWRGMSPEQQEQLGVTALELGANWSAQICKPPGLRSVLRERETDLAVELQLMTWNVMGEQKVVALADGEPA